MPPRTGRAANESTPKVGLETCLKHWRGHGSSSKMGATAPVLISEIRVQAGDTPPDVTTLPRVENSSDHFRKVPPLE